MGSPDTFAFALNFIRLLVTLIAIFAYLTLAVGVVWFVYGQIYLFVMHEPVNL